MLGNSVAMDRFCQNVVGRYLWQLLLHQIHIFLVGIDINMVGWHYLRHTIESLLQLGSTYSKEVDELFGIVATTARPQSSTLTTCQYYAIIVIIINCHITGLKCWLLKSSVKLVIIPEKTKYFERI